MLQTCLCVIGALLPCYTTFMWLEVRYHLCASQVSTKVVFAVSREGVLRCGCARLQRQSGGVRWQKTVHAHRSLEKGARHVCACRSPKCRHVRCIGTESSTPVSKMEDSDGRIFQMCGLGGSMSICTGAQQSRERSETGKVRRRLA